jgi:hypothetical protein
MRFDGGPNAIQRLALVIWWFTLFLAILFAGFGVWLGWWMPRADPALGIACASFAICAWALGRALLYVLAGR